MSDQAPRPEWQIAVEIGGDRLARFKMRVLSDTGVFAREILGWNYDKDDDGNHVNVGSGGVRSDGTSGEMLALIDDPLIKQLLVMAPRLSYKSTRLQAYVCRRIAADPDVRVLYGTKTDEKAQEFALAVRNALESEPFVAVFGSQRDADTKWEEDRFTVATRRNTKLIDPTLRVFSFGSLPTGGHYDVIAIDDLIDQHSIRTKQGIEWQHKIVRMLFPFRDHGCKTIVQGTFYGAQDMYQPLIKSKAWTSIVRGAGVRVIKTSQGHLDLELNPGGLTFPHLTLDYLRKALWSMTGDNSFYDFSCQYLNEVPSGIGETFLRSYFKPARWESSMHTLTGYLLTDTATSQQEEGCYSVLAYVGLDVNHTIYLLDLEVGHWRPEEFVRRFADMLERWKQRVEHRGEAWERISLSTVFQAMLDMQARITGLKLNPIEFSRANNKSKFSRIEKLEQPLRTGKFRVVDTVPRSFMDLDGEKVLWNPRSFMDKDETSDTFGEWQPGGELVDEFLRLRVVGQKVDIADALALVMETGREGKLMLKPQPPGRRALERAGLTVEAPRNYEPQPDEQPFGGDWFDRTSREVLG